MKARAPHRIECFTGEDVLIYGTLAGTESLVGATLRFVGWNESGVVVWDSADGTGDATAEITDESDRTYEATVPADFAAGVYSWEVIRPDTGKRWVHVWGFLTITGEPPS